MTIAFNLSQLANYVNSSGKLDAANGLVNATPVANGGTGAATATAYAVQCGGTTSTAAHQSIASVGTTGQVLTSNGAAALPTFQTPATAGFSNMVVRTTSVAWTVPAGITKAKVTVIGGGGNGGSGGEEYRSGGGGGGAAIKICSGLVPGDSMSVTVGAAGATSQFGGLFSASGGSAGGSGLGGVGGIGSSGDVNMRGQSGGSQGATYAGIGGSSFMGGGGGNGTSTSPAGGAGGDYGGGGGGAVDATGGAGASGVVIIEY